MPTRSRRHLQLNLLTALLAVAAFAIGCGCFAVNTRVRRPDERGHHRPYRPVEIRQPVAIPEPVSDPTRFQFEAPAFPPPPPPGVAP